MAQVDTDDANDVVLVVLVLVGKVERVLINGSVNLFSNKTVQPIFSC
jgi:hypothetical protein